MIERGDPKPIPESTDWGLLPMLLDTGLAPVTPPGVVIGMVFPFPVPAMDGISEVNFDGRFHRFRLEHPDCVQDVLNRLSGMRSIKHFEVVKPSLHDVFVKIANPGTGEA